MAIMKCKMCGGDIELSADKTFGTCEFCGSAMTFPKLDDEQRAAAFNRGNHFRRIGEFDKALQVYERIVQEDDTDAEAHWCCALCRFGIEYVEDPTSYEWLPTCHRASFDSFLQDVDYLAAVAHSDGITRRQYQKDGMKIAEVQRGILSTSQNAQPYDVFICYKESDEQGGRTRDSMLAQEIYYQLTEQGRRVFFARITLENVAGTQYEPYIFAALNSARVMVVVGTKPEHLNAAWVKNEWSRFLAMMKKDRSKLLLPCYRDMDPYDLPEQLSVLQSYDMSKIGFIQDLIRGIAKVLDAEKKPEPAKKTETVQRTASKTEALLKRAFMFLEDKNWQSAGQYCEMVLDMEPENAMAYLGKLMAELQVRKREELQNCYLPFDKKPNYQKLLRFADMPLKKEIEGYNRGIYQRYETAYQAAKKVMENANTSDEYLEAAEMFQRIRRYRDSAELSQQCQDNATLVEDKKALKRGLISAAIILAILLIVGLVIVISGGRNNNFSGKSSSADLQIANEEDEILDERPQWVNCVSLAGGDHHTVGLKKDGTVVAVGYNGHNQCNVEEWTDIVAIDAHASHTVGLKKDGTVVATRSDSEVMYNGSADVEGWTDIIDIAAGGDFTVGLKKRWDCDCNESKV